MVKKYELHFAISARLLTESGTGGLLHKLAGMGLSDGSTSVASFKYQLNKDTQRRAPPKFFSVGSRLGQILHARIRMACSSLNSDLYRKNIVPSPSCACGGFESAYHFSSYAQSTMQHEKDT